MPLESQKVQIPFGQGLAQEIAPALVPAGKLHTADQAVIDKAGSIQQRPGTEALNTEVFETGGGTGVLPGGRHMFADGRGTVLTSPDRVYSYQEADENWADVDHAYEMDVRRVVAADKGGLVSSKADVGYFNGWIVYAWATSTKVRVRFVDYETESISYTHEWAYTSADGLVRVVVAGDYVYVVWHDLGSNGIKAAKWTAANIEGGFTQNNIGASAGPAAYVKFDACYQDGYVWVVYTYDNGVDVGTMVVRLDEDLTNPITHLEPYLTATTVVNAQIAIDVDDGDYGVWVAYDAFDTGVSYEVQCFVLAQADLAQINPATTVRTCYSVDRLSIVAEPTVGATGNRAWVAWGQLAESGSPDATRSLNGAWIDDGGSVEDGHKTYHIQMMSRPWIDDGRIYVVGFIYEDDEIAYGDVEMVVVQNNAYILEMRVGVYHEGLPD